MLKLYYAAGACSLSPHIVLRETATPFKMIKVDLAAKKTEDGGDFFAKNPGGYVPALELEDGTMVTEGPVIVQYIADKSGKLAPAYGTRERYQLMTWLNFVTSELHKGFSPLFNPKVTDDSKAVLRDRVRLRLAVVDKHLADNWHDAKFIYDTARELKIPLMAGSSLPGAWRSPPVDVRRDMKLKQVVGLSYGSLDAYGFHGLEMVQALAERRSGGETGIQGVECLVDQAVWDAAARGVYDPELLDAALARLKKPPPTGRKLAELVPHPVLFVVDYADGLRANIFTLNGAIGEWSAAWRYQDESIDSTLFAVQEARPFMHFALLVQGIDEMMQTGKPSWPVERTLQTSGTLDALLISKKDNSRPVATPYLSVSYQSRWNWTQPAPPPPDRPADAQ